MGKLGHVERWTRALATVAGVAPLLLAGACQPKLDPAVRGGEVAYQTFPPIDTSAALPDYLIGPLDTLDVNVFGEPDVSVRGVKVDVNGRMSLPLIGSQQASGKTVAQLERDLAAALGARYLVNPKVAVNVMAVASQRVTVEGSVTQPGVYDISGRTSLLQAIALARGTTQVAALDEVVVFRNQNGKRLAAVFEVDRIRRGEVADPTINNGDVVVVGYSNIKGTVRAILQAAPFINVFRPFYD